MDGVPGNGNGNRNRNSNDNSNDNSNKGNSLVADEQLFIPPFAVRLQRMGHPEMGGCLGEGWLA